MKRRLLLAQTGVATLAAVHPRTAAAGHAGRRVGAPASACDRHRTDASPACSPARQRSLPIVMAGVAGEPVASSLVQCLARPGGNLTGIGGFGADLAGKALELTRELGKPMRRVGLLPNATDPSTPSLLAMLQQAARKLNIELRVARVPAPGGYAAAFAGRSAARADAVFVQPSLEVEKAVDLSLPHRLPTFSFSRTFALAGGLLSYATNSQEIGRRVASFLDRILKGANLADMPVEQPTTFDLLINLRSAKALGLTIPSSLRLRATEFIE